VSPPVSPPPPPPPLPPQKTSDVLSGPAVVTAQVQGSGTTGATQGATATGAGLSVDIIDPDGVYGSATNPGMNISGNETIHIRFSAPGATAITFDQTLSPATIGASGGASASGPAFQVWNTPCRTAACGEQAIVYKLTKSVLGTGGTITNNVNTKYVTVFSLLQTPSALLRINHLWGAMGLATAANEMPAAGSATFRGTSVGRITGAPNGWSSDDRKFFDFQGDVTLDVDFAKTTGAVTGRIGATGDPTVSATSALKPFSLSFTADRNGSGFSANALTVSGVPVPSGTTGRVDGQFYGPGADAATEAAGVFVVDGPATADPHAAGTPPHIEGGFVAGR
jgi:hypothetical protein